MTINKRIEGVLRLTRPLHCASPDESLKEGGNHTPTMQMRLLTPQGTQLIPYFPGNDLRGRLRRKAASLLMNQITIDKRIKLELYQGLSCGAISASPDGSGLTVEEAMRARDNVYMGLFGGGARLLRSRFKMADLIPVIGDTIASGTVPEIYGAPENGFFTPFVAGSDAPRLLWGAALIETKTFFRIDDVLRVMNPDELEKFVGDHDAISDYQQRTIAAGADRKESKAAVKAAAGVKKDPKGPKITLEVDKKQGVGNMATYQVIMAGTPMHFLLDFADDTTDGHVGLMLLALQALVREQALGGWVRAGLGQFEAHLTLTVNGESVPVFKGKSGGADAELSDGVARFAEIATAEIAQLNAESLMGFFESRAAKEPETAEAA